jgi:class 3 adenylate cyclase
MEVSSAVPTYTQATAGSANHKTEVFEVRPGRTEAFLSSRPRLRSHTAKSTTAPSLASTRRFPREREQAIVGETPNHAARLQGVAEPNSVVIAESTRRLVGDLSSLKTLAQRT